MGNIYNVAKNVLIENFQDGERTMNLTPIINSTIVVSSVFIAELIFNQPRNYMKYLLIFLLTLGGSYAIEACATHEYEEESLYSESFDELDDHWGMSDDVKLISKLQLVNQYTLANAIYSHDMHGNFCISMVENFKWFESNTDRDKATQLYATFIAGLAPGDPKSKIAAMLIVNLGAMGYDLIEKYHEMNTLLCEADYHYTMYVFYQDIYRKRYGHPYDCSGDRPEEWDFEDENGNIN